MTKPKKIGIYGGTFNPIHFGHLRSALEVAEKCRLDKVFFVPSSLPPHKTYKDLASAADRLAMVRLGVRGNPRLGASSIEVFRGGPSYTVETLAHFRKLFGADAELFFILASDAFAEISTWRDVPGLFELAGFLVMTRPGHAMPEFSKALGPQVKGQFKRGSDGRFVHKSGHAIEPVDVTLLDISSSDIRSRIRQGLSVRYLVPESVFRYLAKRELYVRETV